MRGILEEHYGAPVRSMTHVVDNFEDVPFDPTPDMNIEVNKSGKSMEQMLLDGDLDALYAPSTPEPFLKGDKRIGRLFADPKQEEIAYFKKTGIFQSCATLILRRSLINTLGATILVRAFENISAWLWPRVSRACRRSGSTRGEQRALMGPTVALRHGQSTRNRSVPTRYAAGATKKNLGVRNSTVDQNHHNASATGLTMKAS
jgi:hypothetical protein